MRRGLILLGERGHRGKGRSRRDPRPVSGSRRPDAHTDRMQKIPRDEASAFFDALDAVSPGAATPCAGWTVHELTAHLASGADGLAAQAEARLGGEPIPVLEPWPVRESRFAELAPASLRRVLLAAEERMAAAFAELTSAGLTDPVPELGFGFPLAELVLHMRQEFAVHRFDLGADDEAGARLLGQPELTEHSVRMLSEPLLAGAAEPGSDTPLRAVLHCPDAGDDLVVQIGGGAGRLRWEPPEERGPDELTISCTPGDRLLLLWGRSVPGAARLRTTAPAEAVDRLRRRLGF